MGLFVLAELQLEQEESFDFNELAAERFSSIGGGPDAELRFSSFSIAPNAYDADAAFDDAGNPGHEPGFEDHQDLYSGFGQDPEDGNAEPTDGNIYDEQRLGEQRYVISSPQIYKENCRPVSGARFHQ